MRKLYTLLISILLTASVFGQVPQKMSYQAVIRNSSDQLVTNHSVGMRISILQGSSNGTAVYVETQTPITNSNGLATLEIGGGTVVTGTFASINWSTGVYFIKTETDPAGGTSYTITGTSQLLSVPYALYSKKTENIDELMQKMQEMEDLVASQLDPPTNGLIAYYPFNGGASDESGNGYSGTILNAIPAANRFGTENSAYHFDGNSGTERYIYSNIGKHATLSFSVWFKSGTPNTMYPNILNYGSSNRLDVTLFGNHPNYISQNKTGKLSTGAVVGGGYTSFLESINKYIDNKWHHAVIMYVANDKLYLYIDNTFIGETPFTPNNPSDDLFYIGRQINDNAGSVMHETHFNGSIDDIRIYDRKLSEAEIGILYNENGYPSNIVLDIDGNSYNTVKIGTQVWMAENLKTTKYRNGDLIGTTTPATIDISGESSPKYQWATNNNESNVAAYGRLYTWYAATDSRNICPTGWHLPTVAEWTTLSSYLGGESVAGGKLKETGTTHWISPNTGATNESGFTALPGGYRDNFGTFSLFGYTGNWWSSTEYSASDANYRSLPYDFSNVRNSYYGKRGGFSVRCLHD
jgi:uncharacterized protein (TIGR02145 family)